MNDAELRYKIAKMLIMGFDGLSVDSGSLIVQQMSEFALGGVILFDYDFTTKQFVKNIASPEQVTVLNHDLQRYHQRAESRLPYANMPLLISVDYEGGKVDRLKQNYGFPPTYSAQSIAEQGLARARIEAGIMAKTLQDCGFNMNFAPILDVNTNPNNPILGQLERCFSADPEQVAQYANIYAEEFLRHNIYPVFKHFPGHGSSNADSHLGFVDVSATWSDCELEPYLKVPALRSAHSAIMTAHVINRQLDPSGVPATLSKMVLTDLLRQKMQFSGVIISDDMQMKAIADNFGLADALIQAVNAGVNMFIFGNQLLPEAQDPAELISIIATAVKKGKITPETIDNSLQKITKLWQEQR